MVSIRYFMNPGILYTCANSMYLASSWGGGPGNENKGLWSWVYCYIYSLDAN